MGARPGQSPGLSFSSRPLIAPFVTPRHNLGRMAIGLRRPGRPMFGRAARHAVCLLRIPAMRDMRARIVLLVARLAFRRM